VNKNVLMPILIIRGRLQGRAGNFKQNPGMGL
jgi:hypothetical protein